MRSICKMHGTRDHDEERSRFQHNIPRYLDVNAHVNAYANGIPNDYNDKGEISTPKPNTR